MGLTVEAVLLGAPAALTLPSFAQGALIDDFAMGAQKRAPPRPGEARLGLTYVTGTLVSLGERLADALRGAGPFSAYLSFVFLWLALVAGGAAGAAAFGLSGPRALAAPAGAVLLLAAFAVGEAWRDSAEWSIATTSGACCTTATNPDVSFPSSRSFLDTIRNLCSSAACSTAGAVHTRCNSPSLANTRVQSEKALISSVPR